MRLSQSLHILFSFSTLAAGSVIPRDDVNPDDPGASNPKTPPKKLNRPPRPANPFKDGLKTVPPSCTNMMKPSEQCLKDLQAQPGGVNAFSGGELKWDNDNGCSDPQKGKYQTAAWDAHALAAFSDLEPDAHNSRDIALWKAWMGPDYPTQQKRISENLKRASGFLSKKSFDIILNCKDKSNLCSIKKDGKSVGGYASSYKGWFGYWYYYITVCDPFWKSDDLMYKIDQIEEELSKGKTEKASLARWQKNTGQLFLHEMMHLDSVGQPHITDEHVDPDDVQNWAYGPYRTHQLARRNINQGGGATRASTNADSYAWLANSRYFYDLTGYFPEPDNFKAADDGLSAEQLTQNQDGFFIDFGGITEKTTDEEIKKRRDSIVAGFANTGSPSGPSKGKSLSIAMVSVVNSHSGGASVSREWNFFTTGVGKAVGSCGETDGAKLIPQGPSDAKINGDVDSDNPPWPAGTFKLNIEGQDCEYKCDGTNAGRLFCPNKQISCSEDKLKSKAEGSLKCGSRVSFHAAVSCDF